MAHYEDLIKKPYVANHPLIGGKRELARERAVQRLMAQAREKPDLYDDFSQAAEENEDLLDGGDQKLSTLVYKASLAVQELLGQFNFPLMPKISYLNAYKVKRAAVNEDKVVSAEIRLEARIETLTGAIRHLEVPVHVVKGSIIPPSVVYYDGKECLLTQTFVDNMIHSATSYALDPLQSGWHHAPMSKEELGYTIDVRNERGYQPRENPIGYLNYKRSSRKRAQELDSDPIEVFIDLVNTGKYGFNDNSKFVEAFQEMCSIVGGTYWEDNEVCHCIWADPKSQDFKVLWSDSNWAFEDPIEDASINDDLRNYFNEGIISSDGVFSSTSGEVFDGVEVPEEVLLRAENKYQDPRQLKLFGKRKRALRGTPTGFDSVVELLEKAQKDGTDTFPRAYPYLLRKYILSVVSVAEQNVWEPHLINLGWAINPYASNRGRPIQARNKADVSKNVEFEVSGEPEDLSEWEDELMKVQY